MTGRSQKMGGSEKDIILHCGGNGEPLNDFKQMKNTGVT